MTDGKEPIPVENLTELEAVAELGFLAEEIARHDTAYHQNDQPVISDADYDALRRRNDELEAHFPHLVRPDSPSKRVGAAAATGFAKIKHAVPMLSLGNVFSRDELADFIDGVRRFLKELKDDPGLPLEMVAEPKIDGLSISLRYEQGRFVSAATRGDGAEGEDVTANIRTFKDLPFELKGSFPDILEVRGEVYLPKRIFRPSMNARNRPEKKFLPTRATRRRGHCASSIRQLPPDGPSNFLLTPGVKLPEPNTMPIGIFSKRSKDGVSASIPTPRNAAMSMR